MAVSYYDSQLLLHYLNGAKIPDNLLETDGLTALGWIHSYKGQYESMPSDKLLSEKFNFPVRELEPLDEVVTGAINKRAKKYLTDIQNEVFKKEGNPIELLDNLLEKVTEAKKNLNFERPVTRLKNYQQILNDYLKLREQGKLPRVASTGFEELDSTINGLERGDIVVLYARPASGKSTIARKWAVNAFKDNKTAIYFGLEESPVTNMQLMQSLFAGIDSRGYTRNTMPLNEFLDMSNILTRIDEYTGDVITPLINVKNAEEILWYLETFRPDFYVLDQLTIFSKSLAWEDMARAIYRLKNDVSMSTGIPGLILTQASRGGNIGFADAVLQAADKVLKLSEDANDVTEFKELTIEKNRRGEAGKVIRLNWDLSKGLVEELNTKRFTSNTESDKPAFNTDDFNSSELLDWGS